MPFETEDSDLERGRDDETSPTSPQAPASGAELARQALEQAKADARRRGSAPARGRSERREYGGDGRTSGSARGGRAGSRDEPMSLSGAINEFVADRGWELPAAVATVFARWNEIVGEDLAAHCRPESFEDGELLIVADSAAWATQLTLLSSSLAQRLNAAVTDTSVRKVRVRGPARTGRAPAKGRIPGTRG